MECFWDPEAVKTIFDTSIKIEMVALESTNQVPLTPAIRQMWANQRQFIELIFRHQLCSCTSSYSFCHQLYLLFMGCIDDCSNW